MIINIFEENFSLYKNIPHSENLVVKYIKLFNDVIIDKIKNKLEGDSDDLKCIVEAIKCFTGRTFVNCKRRNGKNLCCIFTSKKKIIFKKKNSEPNELIETICEPGNILIIGTQIISEWKFSIPKDVLLFCDENFYEIINLTINERIEYSKKIKYIFEYYLDKNIWEQCIKKNNDINFLGVGGFGNVYGVEYMDGKFAIKMTDATENTEKKRLYLAMKESFFLNTIVFQILNRKLCPNFPLVFENFSCNNCDMKLSDRKIEAPCLINCLEFADGTLYELLKKETFSRDDLNSFLFQIMVALHVLQYHYQVGHFDIKKQNILFYKIKSGGYWKYTVYGKDYFIPNIGYILILNDFGLSKIYSPKFPEWMKDKSNKMSLGTRIGIIKNGKLKKINNQTRLFLKNFDLKKVKIPIMNDIFEGAVYYLDKKLLQTPSIESIKNPDINRDYKNYKIFEDKNFLPLEFYNDTQDAIRMFTGGKKITQKDNHKKLKLNEDFISDLKNFLWHEEESIPSKYPDDTCKIFAGCFINQFFGDNNIFTKNRNDILEKYIIS
jgi:hypothetical protein